MLKRIICIILSVIMAVSCFSLCFGVSAADDTMDTLVSLVKRFPAGKYWNHMGSSTNNPDGWTETPCASHGNCGYYPGDCSCNSFDNAIQCMGYAFKIAYEITGVSVRKFTTYYTFNVENLRVGDVIRYNGHSICVTGVQGTKISFTDANYISGCGIRWGQMDISSIKGFSYVDHLEGNNRKNTDLDFYEDVDTSGSKPSVIPGETWQMTTEDSLNIRSSAATSASIVGSVPAGAEFIVTEKKTSSDYLWGKVNCNGVTGWAVLNYSTYVSGEYEKPEINNEKSSYTSFKVSLSWDAVSGAEKYKIVFYDASNSVVGQYNTTSTSYTMTFNSNGTYSARVYAVNSRATSWSPKSALVKFNVKGSLKPADVTGLKQNISATTATSLTFTWNSLSGVDGYDIYRYNASLKKYESMGSVKTNSFTDKTVKSSRNYYYLVRGYVYDGSTKIVGNNVKFKCSTDPAKVTGITQSGSTSTSVTLKWNKVTNANAYVVYKYNASTKTYSKVKTTTTNSATITQSANTNVYYRVYAATKTDSGYNYSVVSAAFKARSGPAKTTVTLTNAGTGRVEIAWKEVKGATHYQIFRYESGAYKKIATVSADYNYFTNINLTSGKNYYYLVRPINYSSQITCYASYSTKAVIKTT